MASAKGFKIFISTGEVSGDIIGAELAAAIKSSAPETELVGVGGCRMAEAGVKLLFETEYKSSIAITDFFATIPEYLKIQKKTMRLVRSKNFDAAVLIGHDLFHVLLGRRLKSAGIKTLVYFPPQIWLWGRFFRFMVHSFDRILTSFPSEHEAYKKAGGNVRFVGHYLLDSIEEVSSGKRRQCRREMGISTEDSVVALLPGSRWTEVEQLTPILVEAARKMSRHDRSIRFILPAADTCFQESMIRILRGRGMEDRISLVRNGGRKALASCDAAIVCAGTATLEAALMGVPMVIVYRISTANTLVIRFLRLLGLMEYSMFGLPNLLSGKVLVPELNQDAVNPGKLKEVVLALLRDPAARQKTKYGCKSLRGGLGPGGGIARAAETILTFVQGKEPTSPAVK